MGQRPYYPAKRDSRKQNLTTKGTAVFGSVQGAHTAGHGNGTFQQGFHPATKYACHRYGPSVTNQFGKVIRKYEWNGTGEAMQLRLAEILSANFAHYFKPSPVRWAKASAAPAGYNADHFSTFSGESTAAAQPKPNTGRRPYTDEMPDWMKDGALVLFEGAAWHNPKQTSRPFFRNDRMV